MTPIKSGTKKNKLEKPLTEVELEFMNAIWGLSAERSELSVRDVQEALKPARDLAYTSVATIMKILEQKGALASRKADRAHSYSPLLSREEYEAASLRHLATNVFRGDPSSMVARLLDESDLSVQELKAIRALLDERLGK